MEPPEPLPPRDVKPLSYRRTRQRWLCQIGQLSINHACLTLIQACHPELPSLDLNEAKIARLATTRRPKHVVPACNEVSTGRCWYRVGDFGTEFVQVWFSKV